MGMSMSNEQEKEPNAIVYPAGRIKETLIQRQPLVARRRQDLFQGWPYLGLRPIGQGKLHPIRQPLSSFRITHPEGAANTPFAESRVEVVGGAALG